MQVGLSVMFTAAATENTPGPAADLKQEALDKALRPALYAGMLDQAEKHQMAFDGLEQRGKRLRAALQRKYEKLAESHQLRGGLHGTDVTDAVLPYIPIGISFSDAETVLKDAGFVVGPHPDLNAPPNPNRAKDWYSVVAKISPFAGRSGTKVDLYVSLLPRAPGDYTVVSKISATFFVSSL
jgi:hypothetical protein